MKWVITMLFWVWGVAAIRADIHDLKTDPVCEHARAALDTVNKQREARHE